MERTTTICTLILVAGYALGQTGKSNGALNPAERTATIEAIRGYALSYEKSLPNYTCTQKTSQISRPPNAVNNPSIQTTNNEEQVSYVDRQEIRKIVRVDGHPIAPDATPNRRGMSQGEFAYLLNIIFEPATGADLRWDRADKLDGRLVDVIAFQVPQSRGYLLKQSRSQLKVPFEGLVYADVQTHAVLRIQMKCTMIPANSDIKTLELTLEYKAVQVAGQEFILPSHFVLRYLDFTEDRQHINEGKFSDYRRFSTDAEIQFQTDKP